MNKSEYKQKLSIIVDEVRDDFKVLGVFAFSGKGDIDELRKCFINVFEKAVEAQKLFKESFPDRNLPTPHTLCYEETNDSQMMLFYDHLKDTDFSPMPMDVMLYRQYTMELNQMFIALQQA